MRNKFEQMSIWDIYNKVSESVENNKPRLIELIEKHINFEEIIPDSFRRAFYSNRGRNHTLHLTPYIRALILQKVLGIPQDRLLLDILNCSRELREFCGFAHVPDASQISRFKKDYANNIAEMFEHLVDLTEPICAEIDEKKADYLIYDTTGIELPVHENNPKYLNSVLKETKKLVKNNPDVNPYGAAYNKLPDKSQTNSDARHQYINGHFCYAIKVGLITNGLGIPRHIAFFDDDFRAKHSEIVDTKTDNPDVDKEIGDSTSLRPVLSDFREAHPNIKPKTFLGDSAFDSYDNYKMLRDEFGFERVCIPINPRNSKNSNAEYDKNGTPICPIDKTPFVYLGKSGGENRSERFKWVCHKSIQQGTKRVCTCEHPCTESSYGRCVYTYPDKDFRLYPGIARGTEHWDNLYRHRITIERTIELFKDTYALDSMKSHRTVTTKADIFLAGIAQLINVLLAKSMENIELFKSIRKLVA